MVRNYFMKKNTKRLGLIIAIVAVLCLVCKISPTLEQQVPFNRWVWNHHPVQKIRYYMSDSIIKWLKTEHPTFDEVINKLGIEKEPFDPRDRSQLTYLLKKEVFMDWYVLVIDFNDRDSVIKARVAKMD